MIPIHLHTPRKRVGLFVAHYLLERCSVIINSMIMLAQEGYDVDVFHYRAGDLHSLALDSYPSIHLHDLNDRNTTRTYLSRKLRRTLELTVACGLAPSVATNLLKGIKNLESFLLRGSARKPDATEQIEVIPEAIAVKVMHIATEYEYVCFIAYDLGGLALAGMACAKVNVPVLYHSLELALSRELERMPLFIRALKEAGSKYMSLVQAIIIQDEERGNLLCEDWPMKGQRMFYVPVAGLGDSVKSRGRYLHEYLGLDGQCRVALHVGGMGPDYRTEELISASEHLPPDWVVVFHGNTDVLKTLEYLHGARRSGNVYSSDRRLSYNQLLDVVSSADIGLVFYDGSSLNCFHTGLASDKMALYMRCGIPAITPDFPSFKRIVEQYKCGVCVSSPRDFPDAIKVIQADYAQFRANAFRCYNEVYEFSKYYRLVLDFLASLALVPR